MTTCCSFDKNCKLEKDLRMTCLSIEEDLINNILDVFFFNLQYIFMSVTARSVL